MKLNKIEKLKLKLKPYEYYERIERLDISSLSEEDRFYLKNFGIYNTKLTPDKFMLRIRIAAGRIDTYSLEKILNEAKKHGAKIILTARSQIELHDLSLESVIKIHKNLSSNSITSFGTLSDNVRNIVTDPLDGVGEESFFEVYPLVVKMQESVYRDLSFLGSIPRKFNTAISANSKNIRSFFANDCYFALAKKGERIGFNLYLGGKNLDMAKDADIFVEREDAVCLFEAVVRAYDKYGLRESRTKARLYHLIEAIGMEDFKEKIKEFYKKDFQTKGELVSEKYESLNSDYFPLKDGTFAYRFKTFFGEIREEIFRDILEFAKERDLEIRLGVDQNIYILGLKEKSFPIKSLSENQNILACAGSRYCIFSLFDIKKEASKLILDKINALDIKVGYSGCLKGCGRHILADIGFVGIRTRLFGKLEHGVRFYLGGLYTEGEAAARLIYWAVPLRKLNEMIEVVLDEFENSPFRDFEEFSKEVLNSYSSEFLAFWFLYKMKSFEKVYLKKSEEEFLKEFGIEDLYAAIKEYERAVFG